MRKYRSNSHQFNAPMQRSGRVPTTSYKLQTESESALINWTHLPDNTSLALVGKMRRSPTVWQLLDTVWLTKRNDWCSGRFVCGFFFIVDALAINSLFIVVFFLLLFGTWFHYSTHRLLLMFYLNCCIHLIYVHRSNWANTDPVSVYIHGVFVLYLMWMMDFLLISIQSNETWEMS